jgi:hypothetical protein
MGLRFVEEVTVGALLIISPFSVLYNLMFLSSKIPAKNYPEAMLMMYMVFALQYCMVIK